MLLNIALIITLLSSLAACVTLEYERRWYGTAPFCMGECHHHDETLVGYYGDQPYDRGPVAWCGYVSEHTKVRCLNQFGHVCATGNKALCEKLVGEVPKKVEGDA